MSGVDRPRALIRRLQVMQLRLAMLALAAMMMVTVIDVFARYTFNSPLRGSYEMVEVSLVLFVFNGMSAVFLNRKNIVIDLIDFIAPRRLVSVLSRIGDALSVAVLGLFAWAMISPALEAYGYGDIKLELGWPIYILYIVAMAGLAGTIAAASLVALLRSNTSTTFENEEGGE